MKSLMLALMMTLPPQAAETLYRQGTAELANKNYQSAANSLAPYVKQSPEDAYGHYYLGLAHYSLGRPEKALASFRRFLALAPNAPESAQVASLIDSLGRRQGR